MPVGTRATVKAVDPREPEQLGAQIILGNTYHLNPRPGDRLVVDLGDLHRSWLGRPLLTDTGGFQVFSLGDILLIAADGVIFSSTTTGRWARRRPRAHGGPGPARRRHRDGVRRVPAGGCAARYVQARSSGPRVGRALCGGARAAASRSSASSRAAPTSSFRRCAGGSVQLPFAGYAIGGLGVGEELSGRSTSLRPTPRRRERPRYSWRSASGQHPARSPPGSTCSTASCPRGSAGRARRRRWEGRLNLRNARFARDDGPAAGGLRVPGVHALLARLHPPPGDAGRAARPAPADACTTSHFLLELCREARRAIIERRFGAFSEAALERLGSGTAQRRAGRGAGGVSERGGDHRRLDRRPRGC